MQLSVREVAMSKNIRDDQIVVRISRPLRAALEDAAMVDGDRGLSGMVRKALVDFATKHVTERADVGGAR
jgi:hypothetical protein